MNTQSLGLRYIAGTAGGVRPVTWAHVCELPDPWRWHKPGDLVMTTGGGLPEGAEAQGAWLRRLIGARVSALVIAPSTDCPELTEGLTTVAEQHGFPVLGASFELEFVTLARTVIESAMQTERGRLASIQRLYDLYWEAVHTRPDLADRLRVLDRALGWHLYLLDARTHEVIAASREGDPPAPKSANAGGRVVDVRGRHPAILMACPSGRTTSDETVVQHLGGIIALELEYEAAQRDRTQATGAALLANLLDGDIDFAVAGPELERRGLGTAMSLACWSIGEVTDAAIADFRHEPRLRDAPLLLLHRGRELFGIVPGDGDLAEYIVRLLGAGSAVGISARLGGGNPVPEALAQARLALARAAETGHRAVRYGEETVAAGLLPRTVSEAREIAERVLGPLTSYDAAHGSDLTGTVRAFLDHDRSWQHTANALGVHRQTLAYRLRNAEKLTGLRVGSAKGTAAFWLAFQAADQAGGG